MLIDLAYDLSFVVTSLTGAGLCILMRSLIRKQRISLAAGKNYVSFGMPLVGLISGVVVFPSSVALIRAFGSDLSFGHGEIIIAAPMFNTVLGALLGAGGRILLGWKPIKW